MAIGRSERWEERKPKVEAALGGDSNTLRQASKLFELLEMAWHDWYGDVTPPEDVIDNVLLCSEGTLGGLVEAAQLAVVDQRATCSSGRPTSARDVELFPTGEPARSAH